MNEDDIFIRLVEAVEEQGGELLPRTHYGEPITYPMPSGRRAEQAYTAGCELEGVMSVPYDHVETDRDGEEHGLPELRTVIACAIDDAMHLWPRFNMELP